jgi:alkanesulfonate monooxygenase SsuD/methylene tetrahydromethanopterin reductase-like flavin-dependent oxidoreductase (luciferase family)
VKAGIYLPNFGCCGDAQVLAGLAREAEDHGWDGIFLWDHLQVVEPAVDPWIALTAMALRTERIRLGTLVTPVPRRHIAKLAREVSTLDQLSGGRLIFGAGAGYSALPDYSAFGDSADPVERAAQLDEGLTVLNALWSGGPVKHTGEHFTVSTDGFTPPLQRPRPPVWTAATLAARKPLARAARWDGLICADKYGLEVEPDALHIMVERVAAQRTDDRPFDVIRFGHTLDADDTATVTACAQAGATWWMEYTFPIVTTLEHTRQRLHRGPPRV